LEISQAKKLTETLGQEKKFSMKVHTAIQAVQKT
jgi:hypothetical protein